jgi:hypothetical protein
MTRDQVPTGDKVEAGLATAAPPVLPCPICGKESKADHEPGWRICSARDCRHRFPLN